MIDGSFTRTWLKRCLILDIDGVIGDLMGASCDAINRRFGTEYRLESVSDYDLSFLTIDERVWITEAWYATPILSELNAYPEFLAIFPRLAALFDYVIVATDREEDAYEITRQWLLGIGITYDRLFVQPHAKLAALAILPANCQVTLVDDRPSIAVLQDLRVRVYMPDRPWNQIHEYDPLRVIVGEALLQKLAQINAPSRPG